MPDKSDTKFLPGVSGNPRGRPRGKSKSTQLMEAIVTADPAALKEIGAKVVEKAKAGSPWACQLIFDRLWPLPRGRLVQFELPPLDTLSDIQTALNAVMQAVANGTLTIEEGENMASMITDYAKPVIENVDFERRLLEAEPTRA
jgi:hypothetical protein